MKLFKHSFQLCGNRQTEVASVLDEGYTLVGNVEENDGSTQDRASADNLCVNDVADADKGKNQHLFELCELYIYANYLNLNILISCNLR